MHRKTSIIITGYDTLESLQICIESIRAFTDFGTYEIIVIENTSVAAVVEWLQAQDDIICIFSEKNEGFSRCEVV